jgi:alpha-beta hydrolase superfamily lysophospholipase
MFEVTDAAELAADGYFVVVFDERGQGRSTYA